MEKTWPTMKDGQRRPKKEEVISKIKDDGDFDNLRLTIIRKIKENDELRSNIITELKQSAIFNQEGSENLGPKQLSDAVYQELGKKIMGQISDELWKVIRTDENVKTDIRGTVESVYSRILNPSVKKEDHHPSPSKENTINGKEKSVSPPKASTMDADMCDGSELKEPPGFGQSDQLAGDGKKVESKERDEAQQQHLPTEEVFHCPPNPVDDDDDDMPPPGFGTSCLANGGAVMSLGSGYRAAAGPTTSDAVGIAMPRGLGTNGGVAGNGSGGNVSAAPRFGAGSHCGSGKDVMPSGFPVSGAGANDDDDDDDLDVPPGFG